MARSRSTIAALITAICISALIITWCLATADRAIAGTCVKRNNVEAIIDDSGSMVTTDPNKLRVEALELFINKPANTAKTVGAVEFGTAAGSVFTPAQVGPNITTMTSALDTAIAANNGSTNYNDAFSLANSQNPDARARVLLTDGGHNVGDYANGHQGGPPTYVIGFGDSASGGNAVRLQQIATETGGVYYAQTSSRNLQAVTNEISAALNCSSPPTTFKDVFSSISQIPAHAVRLASTTRTVDIDVTWSSPVDSFDLASVQVVDQTGKAVAKTAKVVPVRKLKLDKRSGKTFITLRVKNARIKRGRKLNYRLLSRVLAAPGAAVTSQVTQNN